MRIQRGAGRGSGSPVKSQKYRVLNNTAPDPLKVTKLPSKHSMWGHHRHASETPFKWRGDDGPLVGLFVCLVGSQRSINPCGSLASDGIN